MHFHYGWMWKLPSSIADQAIWWRYPDLFANFQKPQIRKSIPKVLLRSGSTEKYRVKDLKSIASDCTKPGYNFKVLWLLLTVPKSLINLQLFKKCKTVKLFGLLTAEWLMKMKPDLWRWRWVLPIQRDFACCIRPVNPLVQGYGDVSDDPQVQCQITSGSGASWLLRRWGWPRSWRARSCTCHRACTERRTLWALDHTWKMYNTW